MHQTSCFVLVFTEPEEIEGNFRLGMVLLVEGRDEIAVATEVFVTSEEDVAVFFTCVQLLRRMLETIGFGMND